MNKLLKSLFIAASLALVSGVAHANSCCGSQAATPPSDNKPAVSASADVSTGVQPAERGIFGRFFSRFGSSRGGECTMSKSECPAQTNSHPAVMSVRKDKEDSKSGGCCPAKAVQATLASSSSDCSDKVKCCDKAECGDKAECAVVAESCDKPKVKDCAPCARAVGAPVATTIP